MILDLLLRKKEFIKFSIVGVSNTLITLISYNILISLGINYIISNIVGYAFGTINGFIWNKKWVFKSNKQSSILFVKFIIVNLITLSFSTMGLLILVNNLNSNKVVAQIMATFITLTINYTLNKLWTFSQ